MKTRTLLTAFVCLALLVACLPLGGCQHTDASGAAVSPTENALIVSNDAYTFGIGEIDAALKSGLLKRADVDPYLPYRDAARAALDESSRQLAAGNTSAAANALAAANAAYAKLQPLLQRVKGK
jgi:hypothetical protein